MTQSSTWSMQIASYLLYYPLWISGSSRVKTSLFSLDARINNIHPSNSLQVVDKFKYLGIQIQFQIDICRIIWFPSDMPRTKTRLWKTLVLDLIGSVNLIKIHFWPKLIYVLAHSPLSHLVRIFQGDWLDLHLISMAGTSPPLITHCVLYNYQSWDWDGLILFLLSSGPACPNSGLPVASIGEH